jgi:hypothetical protein
MPLVIIEDQMVLLDNPEKMARTDALVLRGHKAQEVL